MFKKQSEILAILKEKDFGTDPVAKKIYEILSQSLTPDLASVAIEYVTGPICTDVAEIPISDETQKLLKIADKEDALKYLKSKSIALTLEYMVMLADAFSIFRRDRKCMTLAMSVYSSYFTLKKDNYNLDAHLPKHFELMMYENLTILYSDKRNYAYNVREASLNLDFLDVFNNGSYTAHLENPEFLYAYAHITNLVQPIAPSYDAIAMYKKAIEKGHAEAKIEFREVCRSKKLCTNCGGKFKGFFAPKCIDCGKKKDY